ncbi:MAG: methionine adenosyltransferase, partial [Coriobacteriales bacterium]|nr:methionine adenosyltransferase [Coriobacteriales bacterium]
MSNNSYLFTSEAVTEGHPDKMCDQISDAILDAIIAKETLLQKQGYIAPNGREANPLNARCAVETLATTGLILVSGEVSSQAYIDIDSIVRNCVSEIGYTRAKYGFDSSTCAVINSIHEQSPDISQGVDKGGKSYSLDDDSLLEIGAGDQGMMFGFACNQTDELMPLPIFLANRLAEKLSDVRKSPGFEFLRPDAKTQVTVRYEDDIPKAIDTILISTQHSEDASQEQLEDVLRENVIDPIFTKYGFEYTDAKVFINPSGRFVIGGPAGDTGLTGRKMSVGTCGGMGRHGGGAFSGKDCRKVDRSGAYAARWVAKNIVAAGLADKCEVQFSYAIGVCEPLSIMVETFGTNKVDNSKITDSMLNHAIT